MTPTDRRDNLLITSAALRPFKRIVVVGATGAVGNEVLSILQHAAVPATSLVVVGSERSVGSMLSYGDSRLEVTALRQDLFVDGGVAIVCADAATALAARQLAQGTDCLLIDNSSAFRLEAGVPLCVPEVNGATLRGHRGLIANPNCSTILLVMALEPLRAAFGIEEIVVSTYQAVSGKGLAAMEELREQTARALRGEDLSPRLFHEPCAFNLFSHDSDVGLDTGVNGEEQKIIDETRKIWDAPSLRVSPTCIRVPVLRAHTESVRVTLRRAASEAELRRALQLAPGLIVIDDRKNNAFPTPLKAAFRDEVLVGRIRRDPAAEVQQDGTSRTFALLICGDQLRKGAATNAVQIAVLAARLRQSR